LARELNQKEKFSILADAALKQG